MTTRTLSLAGAQLQRVERVGASALEPVTNPPGYRSMRTKLAMLTFGAE